MIKKQGFSLIELVIFIVLVGIGIGVLAPMIATLRYIHRIDKQTEALAVAQQRMELILAQRHINGFNSFTDPCLGGSPPSVCALPSGYNIDPNTITDNGDGSKTITVSVTGQGNATLETLVTDY